MKFVLFIFSLFFISIAWGCNLELPEKIIVSQNETITNWPLPSSNCNSLILENLTKSFSNFDGETSTQILEKILSQEFKTQVNINSRYKSVEVVQLKNIVQQFFPNTQNTLTNATFVNLSPILALSSTDEISLKCNSCEFKHSEDLNLIVKGTATNDQNIIINAKFTKMIEAFEVISPINAFVEKIPRSSLRKKMIPERNFQDVSIQENDLIYYRTNKMLKPGDILTKNDLNTVSLVKAGEKTEMTFNSEGISLKTFGIARQHGGLNEMIEVINPLNQKKFIGKVIDYKKIVVDL